MTKLFLSMMISLLLVTPAYAQDMTTILLRHTMHEAGPSSPADADGIYAVLTHRAEARHLSFRTMARLYSRRMYARHTRQSPWIMNLETDCRMPENFHGNWYAPRQPPHRDAEDGRPVTPLPSLEVACQQLVEHIRIMIQSPPTCEADVWGNRSDFRRAERAGREFRYVHCGRTDTRNLFAVEIFRRHR